MLEWKDVMGSLLKDEYFGLQYTKDNAWLNDEINSYTKGINGRDEQGEINFNYLRDNFKCVNYNQIFPARHIEGNS
jgi:hypothetical protein